MRKRSCAKSAASSPPVPARISTMALRSSRGSCGISSGLSCSSRRPIPCSSCVTSRFASADISGSSAETSSRASASSISYFCRRVASSTSGASRRCSRPSSASRRASLTVRGSESAASTSRARESASVSRSRRLSSPSYLRTSGGSAQHGLRCRSASASPYKTGGTGCRCLYGSQPGSSASEMCCHKRT